MANKLIVIADVVILLFVVFGLAGCTESLDEYKTTKAIELQEYGDAKVEENYTIEKWMILQQVVTEGKATIENSTTKAQVDTAFETAKTAIDAIEPLFVLTISVNKTTLAQGENFRVHVELRNNSEQDVEIGFNLGFIAHIPNYRDFFDPSNPAIDMPEPQTILIEKGNVLQNINSWGDHVPNGILITNRLNPGKHELSFHFAFGYAGKTIRVWSNKIVLKVQ